MATHIDFGQHMFQADCLQELRAVRLGPLAAPLAGHPLMQGVTIMNEELACTPSEPSLSVSDTWTPFSEASWLEISHDSLKLLARTG